ncbi:hypothetical protein B0H11DRAFT_2197173 [Mycena galericulata]|nr:hypothetical protein B0H11DRAFT_2197173 [Mycena galericulata]
MTGSPPKSELRTPLLLRHASSASVRPSVDFCVASMSRSRRNNSVSALSCRVTVSALNHLRKVTTEYIVVSAFPAAWPNLLHALCAALQHEVCLIRARWPRPGTVERFFVPCLTSIPFRRLLSKPVPRLNMNIPKDGGHGMCMVHPSSTGIILNTRNRPALLVWTIFASVTSMSYQIDDKLKLENDKGKVLYTAGIPAWLVKLPPRLLRKRYPTERR